MYYLGKFKMSMFSSFHLYLEMDVVDIVVSFRMGIYMDYSQLFNRKIQEILHAYIYIIYRMDRSIKFCNGYISFSRWMYIEC